MGCPREKIDLTVESILSDLRYIHEYADDQPEEFSTCAIEDIDQILAESASILAKVKRV